MLRHCSYCCLPSCVGNRAGGEPLGWRRNRAATLHHPLVHLNSAPGTDESCDVEATQTARQAWAVDAKPPRRGIQSPSEFPRVEILFAQTASPQKHLVPYTDE